MDKKYIKALQYSLTAEFERNRQLEEKILELKSKIFILKEQKRNEQNNEPDTKRN